MLNELNKIVITKNTVKRNHLHAFQDEYLHMQMISTYKQEINSS